MWSFGNASAAAVPAKNAGLKRRAFAVPIVTLNADGGTKPAARRFHRMQVFKNRHSQVLSMARALCHKRQCSPDPSKKSSE